MKILSLSASGGFGGGEKVMSNIVNYLHDNFEFVLAFPQGVLSKQLSDHKIRIFNGDSIFFAVISIRRIILEEKPDVIHAHGTRAAIWVRVAMLLMRNRPKLIYTLHGLHLSKYPFPKNKIFLLIERILNLYTERLVCVSNADKNEVLKFNLINKNKISVIHSGIDLSIFKNVSHNYSSNGRFRLTSICRLHAPKDVKTIIEAIEVLVEKGKDVELWIIGDGPLRSHLEKIVKNTILEDYVIFFGWRDDIPFIIKSSDAIVLSSDWEAFGLVCIEAGAGRKPIIASDIPGVREAVINGQTGLLFSPGNARVLAIKIEKLMNSRQFSRELGENGYIFVEKNYSIERMAEEYKKTYESLTSQ